ncbi:S4 domain-containing protein YaaA [Paenibacillus soyae]|uniref:S4 domain-containing protein YaaA n=1 Tax=Paenibacillus soyae TaxID=2969249 RepID=A0A9X2SB48_9BACL|nr:S4 domain-containing protein YaaA [Paenibacillus soyae]MCR2805298.1 S4 domain-containing protein YaaA [Paenibacillus soyae]
MKEVAIRTEYIELGKFLKLADCISTGGQAKFFLQETVIHINGDVDNRRGRKLYVGDRVEVEGFGSFVVAAEK